MTQASVEYLIFGCGYLGMRLARRLLPAHPGRVAALTRHRQAELAACGLLPIGGDVTDPDSLTALPLARCVVYCVGLDRRSGQSMQQVYVNGLANVLARLPRPQRFVYVSSTSVYGQTDGSWVDESAATEPVEPSGHIVLAAERTLRQHLPDAVILRFAGIYGPGRLLREQSLRAGQPIPADPEKYLNLIHVDDGVEAVLAACERAQPGATINVADDVPPRRREFYTTLARLLNTPPPRFAPLPDGDPLANRRISNRTLRHTLGVSLQYPDYSRGLRQAIVGESN
jgi:nucleoside-diphosphate-sugar epimerase